MVKSGTVKGGIVKLGTVGMVIVGNVMTGGFTTDVGATYSVGAGCSPSKCSGSSSCATAPSRHVPTRESSRSTVIEFTTRTQMLVALSMFEPKTSSEMSLPWISFV